MDVIKKYIQEFMKIITNKSNRQTLRDYIIRGSFGSFVIKVINIGLIFAYSFVLVRLLGAEEYGIYEYVLAWVNLLTIPVMFGLDKLSLRVISASLTQKDWGQIRGMIRGAIYVVIFFTILTILGIWIINRLTSDGETSYTFVTLWVGAIVVPITALTMIWEGFLRGLHHVLDGQLPILVIRPGIAMLFIGVIALFTAIQLDALLALIIYNIASLSALLLSMFYLARYIPDEVTQAPPVYKWREWFASAFPIMLMSGMIIITQRLGTIFLGINDNPEGAGIYALVFRLTNLITFAQVAVGVVISPTIASLFAEGEIKRLQKVATQSVQLVFAVSIPLALMLFFGGYWVLLFFGEEFAAGTGALQIMIIGDMVNIAMGTVGVILTMAGFERDALQGFILGVVVNFICCLIFVPSMGVTGAALALSISNVVWNIYLVQRVQARVGIFPTIIGQMFAGKQKTGA